MNEDTYRDKLNGLQLEAEALRAKLAAYQSTMSQVNDLSQSTKTDTISRQAAIDALDGVSWMHLEGKHEICDGDWIKADEAKEALKQLPSAQPEPKWIPCSDENPKADGRYLITGKMGTVYSLDFEDGRWYGGIKPVAWMPLPEPYAERRTDEAD